MYNSIINNYNNNNKWSVLYLLILLSGSSRFFVWNALVIELAKSTRSVEAPRPRILLLFIIELPSFHVGEDLGYLDCSIQRGRAS